MATESIREQILQHCEAALAAINGTGAYWTTVTADVIRGQAAVPEDMTALPLLYLQEGDESEPEEDTNLLLGWRLPVTVEGWVRSALETPTLATLANRFLGDIERALTADPTRGGLALKTLITGRSTTVDAAPGSLASVRVSFVIQYTTLRGDPASAG